MSKTVVVWEKLYTEHFMGEYHPESPARLIVIKQLLDDEFMEKVAFLKAVPATHDEIAYVHGIDYINEVAATGGKPCIYLDPDTSTSPKSYEAALLAVGGGTQLTEKVIKGEYKNGFAFVRPPGHHAEHDTAMGFCLFNNIAVAAEHAIKNCGIKKIAIVDFDVHHGNGTQNHFYTRKDVLYVSSHHYHFYPGSGAENETGEGEGKGFTVNMPLSTGADDEAFREAYETKAFPAIKSFKPEIILVSAGYDAHVMDPLGGMRLTTDGYKRLAHGLIGLADELCEGKIVFFLEGGYNLEALREGVRVTLEELIK